MLDASDSKPRFQNKLSQGVKSLRSRMGVFAWGTAVVLLIQRSSDIGSLVCKIFLGRSLPSLDFGAIEPILSTIIMLSLPAQIIFTTGVKSISRLQSRGLYSQCRALISDLQRIALVGSILSLVIVALLQNFILTRLHLESILFVWLMAGMFVVSWWMPLIQAILRAECHYRLLTVRHIIGPLIAVILTFILVGPLGLGLEGAIAARVLAGVVTVVVLMYLIRSGHQGERQSYPKERAIMLRMLIPMSVLLVSTSLAVNFDRLFVRNFMIEHSAGLSAILMLGQIPRMIITPISFVIFPIAAAEHASGRALGRMLRHSVFVCALITAFCCLVFAIFARSILLVWRPEFAPYGDYVWIYALMTGLQALNGVIAQVEMARHEYRFLWFYALPVLLACAGLYIARDSLKISMTLPAILWTLAGAQAVTFAFLSVCIYSRRRR